MATPPGGGAAGGARGGPGARGARSGQDGAPRGDLFWQQMMAVIHKDGPKLRRRGGAR